MQWVSWLKELLSSAAICCGSVLSPALQPHPSPQSLTPHKRKLVLTADVDSLASSHQYRSKVSPQLSADPALEGAGRMESATVLLIKWHGL